MDWEVFFETITVNWISLGDSADYRFCAFFQRVLAALAATLERSVLVMVLSLRFPPIWPPLRPIAAMYADRLEGGGAVTASAPSTSFVERSTIHLASWFGSRGRFPFP